MSGTISDLSRTKNILSGQIDEALVNKYFGMNKSIICHDFQKDIAPNGGLKSRPPDYVFNALPIALQINT